MAEKKFIYLSIVVIPIIVFILFTSTIKEFLSISKKVNANVLMIEGWATEQVLKFAYDEFLNGSYDYMVTTGLDAPEYYLVSMNGYFVFYTEELFESSCENSSHKLEVGVYSEMGGEHCSHFNFYINDSIITDFCIGKKKKNYGISWYGKLSTIDSIMIQFDNDAMGDFGDHNMFVKELVINDSIHLSYKGNATYNRTPKGWEKRFDINYTSYAGLARNRLIDIGADSDEIIVVSSSRHAVNRTLSSALSFNEWMEQSDLEVGGINIVSEGNHARRTWKTYKSILKVDEEDIGVISIQVGDRQNSKMITLKEFVFYLYYSCLLLFY